jgi:DNA-binding XRE family transcriptional regulator
MPKIVKNSLRKIRHELEIDTQQEMANLLGIKQEQYSRYENNVNQPSLAVALEIAKKLNRLVESIFSI